MTAVRDLIDPQLAAAIGMCIALVVIICVIAERVAMMRITDLDHIWPAEEAGHPDVEAYSELHDVTSLTQEARDHA